MVPASPTASVLPPYVRSCRRCGAVVLGRDLCHSCTTARRIERELAEEYGEHSRSGSAFLADWQVAS